MFFSFLPSFSSRAGHPEGHPYFECGCPFKAFSFPPSVGRSSVSERRRSSTGSSPLFLFLLVAALRPRHADEISAPPAIFPLLPRPDRQVRPALTDLPTTFFPLLSPPPFLL